MGIGCREKRQAWMYNYSLGIRRDEASPGFKHFILQPEVDATGHLTSAQGYYDSMYGRIESKWVCKVGIIEYAFIVPANTSATVILPAQSLKKVKIGGKRIKKNQTKAVFDKLKKQVTMELASGKDEFQIRKE